MRKVREKKVATFSEPEQSAEERKMRGEPAKLVTEVLVKGSSEFVTVREDSPLWEPGRRSAITVEKGAFVRIRPPHDASDEQIEELRSIFVALGVLKVIVEPKPKGKVVLEQEGPRGPSGGQSPRETVTQMVTEANTRDRAALSELVEETMGACGL